MAQVHYISSDFLTLEMIDKILNGKYSLALSEEAEQNITQCHAYLQQKIKDTDQSIYGINTGFGSLCNKKYHQLIWSNCNATS
ncbi:hypothetical protein GCM10028895_04990 [Pontibacter rugosus]